MAGAGLRQGLVEEPVPFVRVVRPQAISEDVGPEREHLPVDADAIHGGDALVLRFEESLEKRSHTQAVIEAETRGARGALFDRDPVIAACRAKNVEYAWWDVMGVDVDGH